MRRWHSSERTHFCLRVNAITTQCLWQLWLKGPIINTGNRSSTF